MPDTDPTARLPRFLCPTVGAAEADLSLSSCRAAVGADGARRPDASWDVRGQVRDWWGGVTARGCPRGPGLMRCPLPDRPARWVVGVAGRKGQWRGTTRVWMSGGQIYVGGLVDGRRAGFGRLYQPGRDLPCQEGTFVRDRLHGQVLTRYDEDGGVTLGQCREGVLHGVAARAWGDGWGAIVRFEQGVARGPARVRWPDGRRGRGPVSATGRPLVAPATGAAPALTIALPAGPWPAHMSRRGLGPFLSVAGLDRAEVLAALFNHALKQRPPARFCADLVAQARALDPAAAELDHEIVLTQVLANDLSVASAQRHIDQTGSLRFEEINGRSLFVDLRHDEVDFFAYNCANTPGITGQPGALLAFRDDILAGRTLAHRVMAQVRRSQPPKDAGR